MPDKINRIKMSPHERELRSRLAQLISSRGLVRGNISIREKSCGKPNCRCARGQMHRSVYLVVSEEGKFGQLFIPKTMEAQARQWVESYQQIRDLLEKLSALNREKLRRRET